MGVIYDFDFSKIVIKGKQYDYSSLSFDLGRIKKEVTPMRSGDPHISRDYTTYKSSVKVKLSKKAFVLEEMRALDNSSDYIIIYLYDKESKKYLTFEKMVLTDISEISVDEKHIDVTFEGNPVLNNNI